VISDAPDHLPMRDNQPAVVLSSTAHMLKADHRDDAMPTRAERPPGIAFHHFQGPPDEWLSGGWPIFLPSHAAAC
jgi:hypothetical protein